MRKNKFRAFREQDEKWIYGSLVELKNGEHIILEKNDIERDGHHVMLDMDDTPTWFKEETIGQYTGFYDKNGKEIYKGDIVEVFGMIFEIIDTNGSFCIASEDFINYKIFEDKILEYTGCDNSPAFSYTDNIIPLYELYWNYNEEENVLNCCEVIGNIYENPEIKLN